MKKTLSLLLVLIILSGCFNVFKKEKEHNSDVISFEGVKGITNAIILKSDKIEMESDKGESIEIFSEIYNKFGVKFSNTEIEFIVNDTIAYITTLGKYTFDETLSGSYEVYAKKGDIISNKIILKVN